MKLIRTDHEECIDKHLTHFLGPASKVMHSMGPAPHVYVYGATENRPYQTIVTMGLSSFEMPVPEDTEDREDSLHIELLTYLPADWVIPSASGARGYWPYDMLMSLATYAATENVQLGPFHTIPNLSSSPYGEPFEEGSSLTHCLLLRPIKESGAFNSLECQGKKIGFLHVLPITTAECEAKVEKGFFDSLADLLDDSSIPIVLDPKRRSAVP